MGRTILLVDDEQLFREPIAELLRMDGYFVEEASKAQDAITMFKKKNYDLLITDMAMPGINGVQLIKAIHEISPAIEAIVMSAYGTEATKDKMKRLGVYGYLDKPVRNEQLLSMTRKALKSNRLARLGFGKKEPDVQFTRERILIADDDDAILNLLTEILSEKGYRVTSVNNGNDAYESILANEYDCIILDINMPEMGGVQTVNAIREQDPFTYILLISGEAESEEIQEALAGGADKFLGKPFTRDKMLNTVEKINFQKIRKKKEEQVQKQKKHIRQNFTLYQRLIHRLNQ